MLGHRYGERERVEERDDQGSEIVQISREIKTCERCGETLLITENKEITHAQTPDEPKPEPEPEPETSPAPEPESTIAEPADGEEDDDGLILPNESPDREPGDWPADPVEEIDDRSDESEADWPEPPTEESATSDTADETAAVESWPEVSGEDEGYDAVVSEADDDVDDVIEAVQSEEAAANERTEAGFVRAGPIDSSDDPRNDDIRTEYFCPQCDWKAMSLVASVRRGDICPSCKTGYVAERDPR